MHQQRKGKQTSKQHELVIGKIDHLVLAVAQRGDLPPLQTRRGKAARVRPLQSHGQKLQHHQDHPKLPTSLCYLQHQLARPIIRHHRQVVEVLNDDLVGENVAAIFSALPNWFNSGRLSSCRWWCCWLCCRRLGWSCCCWCSCRCWGRRGRRTSIIWVSFKLVSKVEREPLACALMTWPSD